MELYNEVRKFFGINLDIVLLDKTLQLTKIVEKLERHRIEQILPDRSPFLILEKAVIFKNHDGQECTISLSEITENDCAGHIEILSVIPLILFSKAIALTGRLLAAYITEGRKIVAEVVKTGNVESLLGFEDLRYARPPANVFAYAKVVGKEKRKVSIDSTSWIVGDKFVPAGKITNLEYSIIPLKVFLVALNGGKRHGS